MPVGDDADVHPAALDSGTAAGPATSPALAQGVFFEEPLRGSDIRRLVDLRKLG